MTDSTAPIFVICCARSGSTLLRYVLDTHPSITAPPELHLLLAARQLLWIFEHTAKVSGSPVAELDTKCHAATRTRETLDAIMHEHATRVGKAIWAEKSVSSVDCLDVLMTVYPDARLIHLHRHAADVMASCAQAAQRRQGMFGFEPFVARDPGNPVDGLADYWIDKTRRALDAETRLANPHLRLRYEDLVREPATAAAGLLEFLGLPLPDGMLDSVFTTEHVVGPGDSKILSTMRIHADSIGHGSRLALEKLSADRREAIDGLLRRLDYSPLGAAR
ncbi:MAG TPA: sulfotransferase [Gammaproteobacteria bacterium]|nr:sulfotransferase [Gammaproteobacteria bacterium]